VNVAAEILESGSKSLAQRIRQIVTGRDGGRYPVLKGFLATLAAGYGLLMRLRAVCYRLKVFSTRRIGCPVISVGNLTAGGTGKTPMAIWLARRLRDAGLQVAVISRGYGGSAQHTGGVVSDGTRVRLGPAAAGDEPFMMASALSGVIVLVGRNRFASGRVAVDRFGAQVVILDDGFQHLALHRDLDLVLMDARKPIGNGYLLPRGSLREGLWALRRAHAIVLTRCPGKRVALNPRVAQAATGPTFHCRHRILVRQTIAPQGQPSGNFPEKADLAGCRVFVFSGIADPADFCARVAGLGATVAGTLSFADHHRYTQDDVEAVAAAAESDGATALVTTEKDAARLNHTNPWPLALVVMGVEMDFGSEANDFGHLVDQCLAKGTQRGEFK
jgi:tetraacyldisaccharide 4'-kinase